jgi:cell division protein FtsL
VLFEVHVFAVVRQRKNERFDFVEASRRHFEDFFFCEKVFFGFFFVVGVVVAVVVVVVGFVDVSGVFF